MSIFGICFILYFLLSACRGFCFNMIIGISWSVGRVSQAF